MQDQPKAVRKGEELDLQRLSSYLQQVNPEWTGPWTYQQFPSGYSNLTYALQMEGMEMVLRRPPFGASAKGGHDMFREYRVLRDLYPVFSKVPQVFHYCDDDTVMGAPFYLMERVKGIILRKPGGKGFQPLTAAEYQQISDSWLNTLVALHQVDYQQSALADFGKPTGYAERQVVGWTKRYYKSKTSEVKEIEALIQWLNKRIPAESEHTLVHNDYKYDNVVFTPGNWSQVTAVLDWEMATVGDPLMDLGTSLAYWINEDDPPQERPTAMLPTYFPGNGSRGAIVEAYAQKRGIALPDFVFYYAFGLFKVAVIGQQIFSRYQKGYTQDQRFARLDELVKFCCVKALQAVDRRRLDGLF